MKKLLAVLSITAITFMASTVLVPNIVYANAAKCKESGSSFLGLPTWYKYLMKNNLDNAEECRFKTNISEVPDYFAKILLAVFEIVLRIAGMVAVVFVIWGGFTYMTSQGQPDRLKAGQSTILNALIGLVIAVMAVVVVNLVGASIAK